MVLPNFETPVVQQPRTAVVEAVKIVLDRVHTREHSCAPCTFGMLLDELGFQEHEFVAAGIGLSCIYATKADIDWNALMTSIEAKRHSLPAKFGNEHPYWLSEALKSGKTK